MTAYRRSADIAARVIDGQAFVITPDDNRLHTLNTTATELWLMAEATCDPEQAARHIAERYEVDYDTALADIEACCDDLVSRGIFTPDTAGAGG